MIDHAAKREEIIVAARKVFAQYGYRKTTIEDIAASVYKAKSSVYHYFDGKEEIFKAVIEREAEQISLKIREAIRNETAPVGKFTVYFKTVNENITETVNYFRLLMDEWFTVFDFTREIKTAHEQQGVDVLVSIMREGIATGDFDIDDPEESAKAINIAFSGFWYPFRTEFANETSIDRFISIMLRGLLKR